MTAQRTKFGGLPRGVGVGLVLLWLAASLLFAVERPCCCIMPKGCCYHSGGSCAHARLGLPSRANAHSDDRGQGCAGHEDSKTCGCSGRIETAPTPASQVLAAPAEEVFPTSRTLSLVACFRLSLPDEARTSQPAHPPDCLLTPEALIGPAFRDRAPPPALGRTRLNRATEFRRGRPQSPPVRRRELSPAPDAGSGQPSLTTAGIPVPVEPDDRMQNRTINTQNESQNHENHQSHPPAP